MKYNKKNHFHKFQLSLNNTLLGNTFIRTDIDTIKIVFTLIQQNNDV